MKAQEATTITPKLYTPQEAADIFQVSLKAVYREIETGRLQAVRFGKKPLRIPQEALNQYMKANTTTGADSPR